MLYTFNIVIEDIKCGLGLILNLLKELNKYMLYILFYSTSSINLVMNLREFNILFITYL